MKTARTSRLHHPTITDQLAKQQQLKKDAATLKARREKADARLPEQRAHEERMRQQFAREDKRKASRSG